MKTMLARWRKTARGCAALVLALSGAAAHAQVTCSVNGTPDWDLNFGIYTPGIVNEVASAGSLSFTCSNSGQSARNVHICVGLSIGSGGGTLLNRRMSSGANTIVYRIYRDEARSQLFGLRNIGAEFTGSIGGGGVPVLITTPIRLYGRISTSEALAAVGTYTSVFKSADVEIHYEDYADGSSASNCRVLYNSGQDIAHNGTFTVSAEVLPSCEIVAVAPVVFGERTSLDTDENTEGLVFVKCTNQTLHSIALDDGQHAQGGQRYMRSDTNAELIAYELYQDAARTQRWGSAANERLEATGNGGYQSHRIYARVPAQPTPPPAMYTDTVVITVDY